MKNVFKLLSILFLIVTFIACSDEPPSFRVKNERPTKANVQIKTVANTENINDVQPGTVTNYKEVAQGLVEISAEIQNETDEPTGSFNAEENNNYTIVIANTTPPTIRIDVTDK
jgi:hypothetical protein